MTEVPTFVKGESGYTAKLNQLAAVVRELQKALSAEDLSDLTVVELRALAKERGVDLGDASKKDDIIAAIELATEA